MFEGANDYIHGFGPVEEQRLRDQARVLEPVVFAELPLPAAGRVLEIGCGVGAELQILAERWPELDLVGIDLSETHIRAAHQHVSAAVAQADATHLPFADATFDSVLTIWVLEHVPDPLALMAEAVRVLRPGGALICSEVDNDTLRFDPDLPAITQWWEAFCHRQLHAGGDPYVGRRLASLAHSLGLRDIATTDLAVVSSRSQPDRRMTLLDYLRDLMLSGADSLGTAGITDDATRRELTDYFDLAASDPSIEFEYHATRLTCHRPD